MKTHNELIAELNKAAAGFAVIATKSQEKEIRAFALENFKTLRAIARDASTKPLTDSDYTQIVNERFEREWNQES